MKPCDFDLSNHINTTCVPSKTNTINTATQKIIDDILSHVQWLEVFTISKSR